MDSDKGQDSVTEPRQLYELIRSGMRSLSDDDLRDLQMDIHQEIDERPDFYRASREESRKRAELDKQKKKESKEAVLLANKVWLRENLKRDDIIWTSGPKGYRRVIEIVGDNKVLATCGDLVFGKEAEFKSAGYTRCTNLAGVTHVIRDECLRSIKWLIEKYQK